MKTLIACARRLAARSALFAALAASAAAAAESFYAPDGVGASGYDVVAYFADGRATPGAAEFSAEYGGVTWRFADAQNRDAFAAAPEKYLPQYGGNCAYGVSKGYASPTDPTAWSIADGKLYLNYNDRVRALWLQDQDAYIRAADANWPALAK